ncbi:MAG: hypothetical protein V4605_04405 [Pseudomonadota bacterium]
MNKPYFDGISKNGLPAAQFAAGLGLTSRYVLELCRNGKVFGASKHPLTKKWWIYPPAKLLCQPRKLSVSGSTVRSSTSPVVVLV